MSGARVLLVLPAAAEYLGMARVVAATYAAALPFTVTELEELKVAVSEAVTNAIRHGYPTGVGEITLVLDRLDGQVIVEVADQGVGLQETATAGEAVDEEQMGLGFAFMRSFMDRMEIESGEGRGTRVRMWKRPAESGVDG